MKISIARLKEIIMEEVARVATMEIDENQEGAQELTSVEESAPDEDLEETIEIVDDE